MSQVLVIGYREGLDQAVRRRGYEPFFIVEHVKGNLAGRGYAQVAAMEDAQEVLRALLASASRDIAAVVTGHEQAVFTAAFLRAALDLPGDRDYVHILRFRDKRLQKSALGAELPHAECEYINADTEFEALAARLGTPFIVKPANGFGALRTAAVWTREELEKYFEDQPVRSDVAVVAESFIDGDEIHVDGLWQSGNRAWSCLSRYVDAPMKWNEGSILADAIVGRSEQPDLYEEAEKLTDSVLRRLDAPDSVFHLEAFRCAAGRYAGRLVFGECAIRVAGAMVPEVVRLTYDVDLFDMAVSLGLGETVDPPAQVSTTDHYYGYVFLRRVDGVELTEDDFRCAFPEIHEIDYPAGPRAITGAYGRIGHAIVRHRNSELLFDLLAQMVALNESGDPRRAMVGTGRG